MLTHILSLSALILLCVLWVIFQGWLARQDPDYKGYKAGCGGCTRSCSESTSETCDPETHHINIASLGSQHRK